MIKLIYSNIVISLPTFIIAECVLIYLDPDSSRAIVGWTSKAFSTAIFFLYEQVTDLFKLKKPFWCLCVTFFTLIFLSSLICDTNEYFKVVVLYVCLTYMVGGGSTDSSR